MLATYCDKCGYGAVTVRNFLFCNKIVATELFFVSKVMYNVRKSFIPISCNYLKIEVGFPRATVVPCRSCPSSHGCATCLMIMDKISKAEDDTNNIV